MDTKNPVSRPPPPPLPPDPRRSQTADAIKHRVGTEKGGGGGGWVGVQVQAEKPAEMTEICCETYCAAPRGLFLGGTAAREALLHAKEPPR